MKTARVLHFQVIPNSSGETLWVLDADGVLWRNSTPKDSSGWESVLVPTIKQHRIEDDAIFERERFDITER